MAYPSLFSTFVILTATLALLTPSLAYNILYSGEYLYGGQSLTEGSYTFIMQTDCNLVLYDSGRATWSSGTYRKAENCFLSMQYDGNLVIYSGSRVIWASNTSRARGNFVLVLQRDRNVVLYGPAIWSSGTKSVGSAGADIIISGNSTEPVVIAGDKISMVTGTGK